MAKNEKLLIEAIDNLTSAVNILNDRLLTPTATKPGEKMDMADIMKYAKMGKSIIDGFTTKKS